MAKYEVNKANLIKSVLKQSGAKLKESSKEEQEQAKAIIEAVLRNIKKTFPDLIGIINLFSLYPVDIPINISTDFKRLYFNPKAVIRLSEKAKDELEFQIMHIILHGLLGDNEKVTTERQSKYLWLTQDQRVNDICEKLGIKGGDKDRFFYLKQMKENEPYKKCFGNYYLTSKNKAVMKKAKAAQRLIASDEHFFWHPAYIEITMNIPQDSEAEKEKTKQRWNDARNILMEGLTENGEDGVYREKADSDTVAGRISDNSYNKSSMMGRGMGNYQMKYEAANGKPLEYKTLLREILTMTETQKPLADSIDLMLYQYGLDVYGDVPLIEPKEEDEQLSISTICIAIDTSGSCEGEVAQRFLRETQAIIGDMREYLADSEIIIFQCDDGIQLEERGNVDDIFNGDTANGNLHGFGGTSFVPVFERIETIKETEDKKIDVLVYLTDGYGNYPQEEADFPTIFVINEKDSDLCENMPEWIKVATMEE